MSAGSVRKSSESPGRQINYVPNMPREILLNLVQRLSYKDHLALFLTSKHLNQTTEEVVFRWKLTGDIQLLRQAPAREKVFRLKAMQAGFADRDARFSLSLDSVFDLLAQRTMLIEELDASMQMTEFWAILHRLECLPESFRVPLLLALSHQQLPISAAEVRKVLLPYQRQLVSGKPQLKQWIRLVKDAHKVAALSSADDSKAAKAAALKLLDEVAQLPPHFPRHFALLMVLRALDESIWIEPILDRILGMVATLELNQGNLLAGLAVLLQREVERRSEDQDNASWMDASLFTAAFLHLLGEVGDLAPADSIRILDSLALIAKRAPSHTRREALLRIADHYRSQNLNTQAMWQSLLPDIDKYIVAAWRRPSDNEIKSVQRLLLHCAATRPQAAGWMLPALQIALQLPQHNAMEVLPTLTKFLCQVEKRTAFTCKLNLAAVCYVQAWQRDCLLSMTDDLLANAKAEAKRRFTMAEAAYVMKAAWEQAIFVLEALGKHVDLADSSIERLRLFDALLDRADQAPQYLSTQLLFFLGQKAGRVSHQDAINRVFQKCLALPPETQVQVLANIFRAALHEDVFQWSLLFLERMTPRRKEFAPQSWLRLLSACASRVIETGSVPLGEALIHASAKLHTRERLEVAKAMIGGLQDYAQRDADQQYFVLGIKTTIKIAKQCKSHYFDQLPELMQLASFLPDSAIRKKLHKKILG
jgi:hypothetical protein